MRYTLALAIAAATARDPPVAHAQTEATQAPVACQHSLLMRWYSQGTALQGFYLGARGDTHASRATVLMRPLCCLAQRRPRPRVLADRLLANVGIAF